MSGGRGPNAGNAHEELTDIFRIQGRFEEALEHASRALEVTEAHAPGGAESLGVLATRAFVLFDMGKVEEAWRAFRDIAARAAKVDGAFDALADSHRGQAQILLARGRPAQALPLAESSVEVLARTRGKSHPSTLQSGLVAAEAELALGQREKARAHAAELLRVARVELSAEHPVCVHAAALVARAGGAVAASAVPTAPLPARGGSNAAAGSVDSRQP